MYVYMYGVPRQQHAKSTFFEMKSTLCQLFEPFSCSFFLYLGSFSVSYPYIFDNCRVIGEQYFLLFPDMMTNF